jgi:hypothetical protein
VLNYALACGYLTENLASKVRNPEPQRREVQTVTAAELEALSTELESPCRCLPRAPACAPRSGVPLSVATSTGPDAC